MRTENLMVLVLHNNTSYRVNFMGKRIQVCKFNESGHHNYDSYLAYDLLSFLRYDNFDIRSIVKKLNEIFDIQIEVKNDFCHFSYDSDDVTCKLLISRGIKRYELIHK